VPSEVTYFRSRSAAAGVGLGVLGGNMDGCKLNRELPFDREEPLGGVERLMRGSWGASGTGDM